jgi:trimeric autotransporter adhesin
VASDRRLKKDISTFADGLAVLEKIRPVWFKYNGEAGMPTDKQYVGVIAQEMQKIAPYTVGQFTYQDTTGQQTQYLDYDANALTYILVNAVKEQQKQIQEKDARLDSQQQQIAALTERLNQLETLLTSERKDTGKEAILYQNEPNPTQGYTLIRYYLPEQTRSAQLKMYTSNGQEVHSQELTGKGQGAVQLSVGSLAAGIYIYHLVVDGERVASKKLLLGK